MRKFFLYIFSLIHIKPIQIFFLIKRRIFKSFSIKKINEFSRINYPEKKTKFLQKKNLLIFEQNNIYFKFINKKRKFDTWEITEEPLWIFNLHYFEYLLEQILYFACYC